MRACTIVPANSSLLNPWLSMRAQAAGLQEQVPRPPRGRVENVPEREGAPGEGAAAEAGASAPGAAARARLTPTAAQELLEEKQKLEASSGTAGELESAETLEEELKKVSPPAPRKVATVPDDLSPQVNDQVTMAEEKETMLNLQIAEYERNKEDLARDIDEAKRQKAAEFEPYAKELQRDVDDITGTIQQQKASIQNMDTEKKDCIARIQELQELAKGAFRGFFCYGTFRCLPRFFAA